MDVEQLRTQTNQSTGINDGGDLEQAISVLTSRFQMQQ
jgi:hypothetical protein